MPTKRSKKKTVECKPFMLDLPYLLGCLQDVAEHQKVKVLMILADNIELVNAELTKIKFTVDKINYPTYETELDQLKKKHYKKNADGSFKQTLVGDTMTYVFADREKYKEELVVLRTKHAEAIKKYDELMNKRVSWEFAKVNANDLVESTHHSIIHLKKYMIIV